MRLADMGIETYLIAATVQGIMAQRLCRKVCVELQVEPYRVPANFLSQVRLQELRTRTRMVTLYEGKGCEECRYQGLQRDVSACMS